MTQPEFPADLLTLSGVLVGLRAQTKAALLTELAQRSAKAAAVPPETIAAALAAREALGSTGFGQGIAVPHARLEGLDHVVCLLVQLAKPVAYDAVDGKPVDILFLLLSPASANGSHLATLAAASRRLRRAETVAALRDAATPDAALAAFLAA
jgi:PTS system nitrogen regulatory IIA component